MKDLILITSYHPDNIRENILRELVYNLHSFKNEFDLAIVSHTPIPLDIQNKVNFALYDDKNEILTDSTLLNKPWFAPIDRKIMSSYLTGKNTHLAIWRMFILGFSLAQNMGYKKIHNIEYDASIKNINELKDNSKLLDTYKSIYYLENEVGDYFVKDRKDLETEYNTFAKSNDNQQFNPWGVPYYDKLEKNIKFITWNTTNIKGITNNIIINSEKMINTGNIKYNCWKIVELGKIENINHIIIMENNKVKNEINLFSNEEKDEFRKMSFSEES